MFLPNLITSLLLLDFSCEKFSYVCTYCISEDQCNNFNENYNSLADEHILTIIREEGCLVILELV